MTLGSAVESSSDAVSNRESMKQFSGIIYKLDVDTQENVEDLVYEMGIHNLEVIRNAVTLDSTFMLTVEGDRFTQTSQTGDWKESFSYRLGEPFDQVAYNGVKIRSVITALGPTTHCHVQDYEDGLQMRIEKCFSPEKLVLTLTLKDIVARREYLAVNK
ncbi:fatty acid-binding protein, muscle-like isoform X1 [Schistocerca nitens]|uniref:fatty acid-binding protein, muscle-like isoform X1 n=1 Tax=Schistocerca nitens TaxID=7011 RepID=UPI0021175015|nr:fatty acid-binding protein, muscle-like isoform X1 [Schistocerca nitens]